VAVYHNTVGWKLSDYRAGLDLSGWATCAVRVLAPLSGVAQAGSGQGMRSVVLLPHPHPQISEFAEVPRRGMPWRRGAQVCRVSALAPYAFEAFQDAIGNCAPVVRVDFDGGDEA